MTHHIFPIPALNDNYIWALVHPTHQTVIIDPGDAKPVLKILKRLNLNLAAILITHHHWDHINGIHPIIKKYPVPVYAPIKDPISESTHPIEAGNLVHIPGAELNFTVIDIPGHTLGHIAYYGHGLVFTGDTLFTGGCGRLFEGTPSQMYHSLSKLSELPINTNIYCGHEYTQQNLQFAHVVEPNNQDLHKRILATNHRINQQKPTVPASIALELKTNPFLRCHHQTVINAAEQYSQQTLTNSIDVFTVLRQWKDNFC